jgi:hypothetical protein
MWRITHLKLPKVVGRNGHLWGIRHSDIGDYERTLSMQAKHTPREVSRMTAQTSTKTTEPTTAQTGHGDTLAERSTKPTPATIKPARVSAASRKQAKLISDAAKRNAETDATATLAGVSKPAAKTTAKTTAPRKTSPAKTAPAKTKPATGALKSVKSAPAGTPTAKTAYVPKGSTVDMVIKSVAGAIKRGATTAELSKVLAGAIKRSTSASFVPNSTEGQRSKHSAVKLAQELDALNAKTARKS